MNQPESVPKTGDGDAPDETLLILPLNDTSSKKISQVIASDTARSILEVLAAAPRSASELAAELGIPLTTVHYNLENLCDAGLVRVARTRYSRKMKTVKLYEPQRKIVVIAPAKTSKSEVIAALKRYVLVLASALIGSGAIELLARRMRSAAEGAALRSVPGAPEKVGTGVEGFDFSTHPGLWFLSGCLFVILVLFLIEYLGRKRAARTD